MNKSYTFADQMQWIEELTGCIVNLQDVAGISYRIPCLGLHHYQYLHHSRYCEMMKISGRSNECHANKLRSLAKARELKCSYTGYCENGVWDLVQPVFFDGELMACLYLGSLRHERPLHHRMLRNIPVMPDWTPELEDKLRHYAQFLADQLGLIISRYMTETGKETKQRGDNYYMTAAQNYIMFHYDEDIGLTELAEQLSLHPNHLGQIISKNGGKSFRTLLQEFRIGRAKAALQGFDYTITQIAHIVGFNDSNYFSTVFRKLTGKTPRAYRREHAQEIESLNS